MKTVYSNINHPKLYKAVTLGCFILGLCLWLLELISLIPDGVAGGTMSDGTFLMFVCMTLMFFYYNVSVDADELTISDVINSRMSIQISGMKSITYKENRWGWLRYITIHHGNAGYTDLRIRRKHADRMVAQLLELNPEIKVSHRHNW